MKVSESESRDEISSRGLVYSSRLFPTRRDKELACATTGIPLHYRCLDNQAPKKHFIDYHSPITQCLPSKPCVSCHHGNQRPCYLGHHGNIIPTANTCISYSPIPISPRYHSVCFCLLCQQRATSLSCNCQSCISVRFEQTAATVLRSHEKELSLKSPTCCIGMKCKNLTSSGSHFPKFCHCIECISKPKELRLKAHVEVIASKEEITKKEIIHQKDKDFNNNMAKCEEQERQDKKTDGTETSSNIDMTSPKGNNQLNNEQNEIPHRDLLNKRKHDEQLVFVSKIIKTEIVEGKFKLGDENNLVEIVKEDRFRVDDEDTIVEIEDNSKTHLKRTCKNNDSTDVQSSPEHNYQGFENKNNLIKTSHNEMQNSKRQYNKRYPSSKNNNDKQQEPTKVKKEKDNYWDLKNVRQRTKLNRLLANEHERRRVAQLNSAYQSLRQLIPGYQCDTKLPKIKILRYAINYIAHLDNILETDGD